MLCSTVLPQPLRIKNNRIGAWRREMLNYTILRQPIRTENQTFLFNRSVEKSDAKQYSCTATNEEEGSATAHVNLLVLGESLSMHFPYTFLFDICMFQKSLLKNDTNFNNIILLPCSRSVSDFFSIRNKPMENIWIRIHRSSMKLIQQHPDPQTCL